MGVMTQTILAIDYGLARVGLALGDAEAGVVSSRQTFPNDQRFLEKLILLCSDNDVSKIILGLPRGLDGQETRQTEITREFGVTLERLGIPILMRDEAGTSQLARERLGKNPAKEAVDAESAAIILEEYLHE
jgi:putative Holliday junction resolvase